MVKRKRPNTPLGEGDSCSGPNSVPGSGAPSPIPGSISDIMIDEIKEEKKFVFKDPAFQGCLYIVTDKTKTKKSTTSIPHTLFEDSSIDALPSFKPVKKYSDISGLLAKYTDPQTKLHFAVAEEFSTVRSLPMDITAGYLSLRRANNPMG
uniref:Vps72/YL1 C-terminal domain-containing protein n=1 Tax=Timema genevievae TaxID=629358 RepID=A0A7R9K053_TIMGE|nr:unnamed protein product [Timema genevievae]